MSIIIVWSATGAESSKVQFSITNHSHGVSLSMCLQVYLMCRERWEHLAPAPACSPGATRPGSPGWTLLIPSGWTGWTSSRSQCCHSTRSVPSGPTMTMWSGPWYRNRYPSPYFFMLMMTVMEYTLTTPRLPCTLPCPVAKVSSSMHTCPTWAVPVP